MFLAAAPAGCSGTRAYVDWRPGLSAVDFDGTFEIGLDEYDGFAERGEPLTLFDRRMGESRPAAATAMTEVGRSLDRATTDAQGYALLGLDGEGRAQLRDERGGELSGTVDWFAATADRRWAALLSDTKLAVVIDGASTGIDLGSLLAGSPSSYLFMMLVDGDELTVFALPEVGGVVTAFEPGYILAFRHQPGAREPWPISVARVAIKM